jgi:hypothetical protein
MTGHRFKIEQLVRYYPKWKVSIHTVSGLYHIIKPLPPTTANVRTRFATLEQHNRIARESELTRA